MSIDALNKAHELAAEGKAFAIATVVRVEGSSSAKPGARAVIDADGRIAAGWAGGGCAESAVRQEALACLKTGRPQLITIDMTDELFGAGMPCGGVMDVFVEPVLPRPELLLIGHGRIVEALATLGAMTGYSVTAHDPAATLAMPAMGPRTAVVIATQHKRDHVWIQSALDKGAAYIALIASRHRSALVLDYLAADGTPPEELARVQAPAGLDLGAATPDEIALSIMSQIVALRRGGSLRPLKDMSDAAQAEEAHPGAKIVSQC